MLWTLIGVLIVVILIPVAARAAPATLSLLGAGIGRVGAAAIKVFGAVVLLAIGWRLLSAFQRVFSIEFLAAFAIFGVCAGLLYTADHFLNGEGGGS